METSNKSEKVVFKPGTSAYFLSDRFGFKDHICRILCEKSLDEITMFDLIKNGVKPEKIISTLKYIKTRNEPANASGGRRKNK
tara:strand:+ start:375 stop:623 length:249 start_codon:yes stop_codon:yes gene_type:complete